MDPPRGLAGIPGSSQAIFEVTAEALRAFLDFAKLFSEPPAEDLQAFLDFAKLFLESLPRPCEHSWILPSYFWNPRRGLAGIPGFCLAIIRIPVEALRALLDFA